MKEVVYLQVRVEIEYSGEDGNDRRSAIRTAKEIVTQGSEWGARWTINPTSAKEIKPHSNRVAL